MVEAVTLDAESVSPRAARHALSTPSTTMPVASQTSSKTALLSILWLAVAWIGAHPYAGVIHDARLYAVQAMSGLDPGRFGSDLYLKYGSQDSFTVFSWFYRPLVRAVGIGLAHWIATGIGEALWFAALIWLMRSMFRTGRDWVAGAAACIFMGGAYGGLDALHYGEGFATPRLFAEALVMAALALVFRRRIILACLAIGAAGAMHPIMAATGATILGVIAVFQDRRAWLGLAIGVLIVLALTLAGVEPFPRLLLHYDDTWFSISRQFNGLGFLTRWSLWDWLRAGSVGAILLAALSQAEPGEQRWIVGALIVSGTALVVSFVGGDLFRDTFIVNAQSWRALWLSTLLANAWLGVLACRLPNHSLGKTLALWTLTIGVLTICGLTLPMEQPIVTLIASAVIIVEERGWFQFGRTLRVLALAVVGVALAAALYRTYLERVLPGLPVALLFALIEAVAAWLLFRRQELKGGLMNIGLAALLLFVVLNKNDRRSDWQRYIENPTPDPGLVAFTANSGNIYWESGLELAWFKLRRPTFYGCVQGAGSMFYRKAAIDFQRRGEALSVLNTQDFIDDADDMCLQKHTIGATGAPSLGDLETACRALPDLDTLVLTHRVDGIPYRVWRAPFYQVTMPSLDKATRTDTFFRYDCSRLR